MKYAHYDETTQKLLGFYDDEIHKNIPEPSIAIDDETWGEAIRNGYNYVDIETKTLYYKDERTFEEKKEQKIKQLSGKTTGYIEQFYPQIKQRSDVADKEYDGTALLMINQNYTLDQIYRDAGAYANEIISGTKTVADIVATFPAEEQPHWEQILKVAVRVAWVKACKAVHAEYAALLEAATDQAALDAVDIDSIVYPEYPL